MQDIIKQTALIGYEAMSDEEIITLFSNFLSLLVQLSEEERKKYKAIYWKLTFACQKILGFVVKKETLEAGSKKEIRKKQYDN